MMHRINTLQFEAACATEEQAFDVQHGFSKNMQGPITNVMDKVCSKYIGEEEWIHIDRMEIDMGHFDIRSFETAFTEKLLIEFEKAFKQKLDQVPAGEKAVSRLAASYELLLCFLQNGSLPWWAETDAININSIFLEMAGNLQKQLWHFLATQTSNVKIWQRIAMQFNEEVHTKVLCMFAELEEAERIIAHWNDYLLQQIKAKQNETIHLTPLIVFNKQFILQYAPVFFNRTKENIALPGLIKNYAELFVHITNALVTVESVIANISGLIVTKDQAQPEKLEPVIISDAAIPEKFTIPYAGTILLAPFFKQLFKNLQLLEHGDWKDRECQYKAIHMVKYLASGEQQTPEYSLVFEKLLCGLDINTPVPKNVLLNEEDLFEASELLKSVIANWVKLKNTSIDGLRETFLKREGILSKKGDGWLLQVERKTPDVLLESLPWGFSTLSFTWNSYIIFTEW